MQQSEQKKQEHERKSEDSASYLLHSPRSWYPQSRFLGPNLCLVTYPAPELRFQPILDLAKVLGDHRQHGEWPDGRHAGALQRIAAVSG